MLRIQSEKGFSLVEVLMALAIFSLAFAELGRMQLTAIQANATSGRLTRMTALAQAKIEQLMAVPYTDPSLADLTVMGQTTPYEDRNVPPGYSMRWRVDTDTPFVGVKTVNLTVTWQNRGKAAKTFTLDFYKNSF